MCYVAAYLLPVLGSNNKPSPADINKILSSVGVNADDALVKKVIGELEGKKIEEVMEAGRSKLTAMPAVGLSPPAKPVLEVLPLPPPRRRRK